MAATPAHSRYRILLWISGLFLVANLFTRVGLLWYEGNMALYKPSAVTEILLVGLVYDLAALSWFWLPFSLLALLVPAGARGRVLHGQLSSALFIVLVGSLVFQSTAEFIFWNEFSARFNFIAVDYLVYTREVVGNIQQSYPAGRILAGVAVVTVLILLSTLRPYWRAAAGTAPRFRVRLLYLAVSLLLSAAIFVGLTERLHLGMDNPAARELASNGSYSLFRAFRNNELSYATYYATLDDEAVQAGLAEELHEAHAAGMPIPGQESDVMARRVPARGASLGWNLVLVSVESLGSDYVDAFDGKRGLTPQLDALATESLIFSNLYATGLRTVRGLEAITLSIPPTPGRAVPIREHNKGLQTLGGVLQENGYEALYFYGGYSLFDNMRDFFGGNGYRVLDRSDIPDDEISHETIWGVADEDLYRLALRELDAKDAAQQPFFAHIMTTSNHRPYTYPAGRVLIPSHSGRSGAVQYTDWAIGEFMREARLRPWYRNTIFVFLADHTSHGRGRIDLPPENYRIPLIVHAPGLVEPGKFDSVASQIDLAPTMLSLLNIAYDSHFFGQDILHEAAFHPRAFMANYLTVGYMEGGRIVELGPRSYVRVVDAISGDELSQEDPDVAHLVGEAISYYQAASAYVESATAAPPAPAGGNAPPG